MARNISYVREKYIELVSDKFSAGFPVAVMGESGSGKLETVKAAVERLGWGRTLIADGHSYTQGYFGGFHELFDLVFSACSQNYPKLISQHEQALKRLFPKLDSPYFLVPKDLTNTSELEERTRFYHHEYQNKILHDVFGFIAAYFRNSGDNVTLIIDRAESLLKTAVSFLAILFRKYNDLAGHLRIIALFDKSAGSLSFQHKIAFDVLDFDEAANLIKPRATTATAYEIESLWRCSEGNPARLDRLLDCHQHNLRMFDYLDAVSLFDFLLDRLGGTERRRLLETYIKNHCVSDDPLVIRNYETADQAEKDSLHRQQHQLSLEGYEQGKDRLRIIHALSVSDPFEQLAMLCGPSVILKGIGLYDTWFEFFGRYFTDPKMRKHGTGEDEWNAAFANVAFILYSLGLGSISIPYLDLFYEHFPASKLTPTVLYAQSMTYGRYQIPVNLEKANDYAERNLKVIDSKFRHHDKYKYIKVFAENALAYIRARQGNYDEALRLCTTGNQQMNEVYGDQRFKLHQSILIYNTGQIYELLRDYENTEKHYALAISFDPYYAEYYNDMANLYSKMKGRENDALAYYQKAIDLSPSYYEVYLNRASLLERLGRQEEATADYRQVIDIKPTEFRAYYNFGTMLLRAGRNTDAMAQFKEAERYQVSDPELYNNLGIVFSEIPEPAKAIDFYKRAIQLKPDYAEAHNNLAIALFETGDAESAVYHARKATEGSPEFRSTLNFLEDTKIAV